MATYDYLKSKNGHKIQVESAKRDGAGKNIENNYAKQNGYYAQLTAGLADNLTPYSEDSGVHQENPFISNGTGTNNNQEIVTVGNYALVEQKQGNSAVVNQLFLPYTYTSLDIDGTSSSFSSGKWTVTVTDSTVGVKRKLLAIYPQLSGRKVFFRIRAKITNQAESSNKRIYISAINSSNLTIGTTALLSDNTDTWTFGDTVSNKNLNTSNFQECERVLTLTNYSHLQIGISGTWTNNDSFEVEYQVIDLNQWGFTDAIIDDITANPSHFFWYYNGSLAYNTGSLESANGVKLVSTGRNLFDGNLTLGGISGSTGEQSTSSSSSYFASTNFIQAISNKDFILSVISYPTGTIDRIYLHQYDKNKNYLGRQFAYATSHVFTLVSGTAFVKLEFSNNSVELTATPNIQIVFSLYYTPEQGGEGYDKYYPYEQPTIVDTGSEVLRKAGSVRDYKTKDGVIHKVVDNYTFTGNETFGGGSSDGIFVLGTIANLVKKPVDNNTVANITCNALTKSSANGCYYGNLKIAVTDSGAVYLLNTNYANDMAGFKSWITGKTFNYELAEETTEQGTPFAENLPINDYGMLYWLDTNNELVGIPQGVKIFFPVNYKGFVDDVYSRADGDAGNLVLQDELQESETERDTVDTQLLNAIGGTLRHLLASSQNIDFNNTDYKDMSTISWNKTGSGTGIYFYAAISEKTTSTSGDKKILCTKYQTQASSGAIPSDMNILEDVGTKRIVVKDSNLINLSTTEFAAAMKGVLLAYEKA